MKITRNDGARLEIVDTQILFTILLVALGVGGTCQTVSHYLHGRWEGKDDVIMLVASVAFPVVGLLIAQYTRFSFDLITRQLEWKRLTLVGSKSGTVPLTQISRAYLDADPFKPRMVRLALQLTNGAVLPLKSMYLKDASRNDLKARDAINQVLGHQISEPTVDESIQALVRAGRPIAAIKLVREQRQCSLIEAKKIVDELAQSKDAAP